MPGVLAYGAYVPYHRLDRADIGKTLGSGGGKGTRAVASYDEDSTSLGVEAARVALRGLPQPSAVEQLYFATATPPYLDKTNATVLHAALRLDPRALAVDMVGSVRSGVGAFLAGAQAAARHARRALRRAYGPARRGRRARRRRRRCRLRRRSRTRRRCPVLAELVASASATEEFLDRWRIPGDVASRTWEERFGEDVYLPLAGGGLRRSRQASRSHPGPGRSPDRRRPGGAGRESRGEGDRGAARGDRRRPCRQRRQHRNGASRTAARRRARPGRSPARASSSSRWPTGRRRSCCARPTALPAAALREAGGRSDRCRPAAALPYPTYLTWRGLLDREPPRRPDPDHPYAAAGLPPARVEVRAGRRRSAPPAAPGTCRPAGCACSCHAVDEMLPEPMADVPGTLATYTVDRLAYSLNPPLLFVAVDFDGGGRFRCELTDAAPGRGERSACGSR